MVEWSITTVLKTVALRGAGGSNPSLSAILLDYQHITANLGNIWETTNFLFRLKEKWMEFNAGGLSLSLDVLIYTIRYNKPKSEE